MSAYDVYVFTFGRSAILSRQAGSSISFLTMLV